MPTTRRIVDRAANCSRRLLIETGRELRQARLDRGLSARAVARAVDLSATTVSRLERGLVPEASVLTLARIHEALGLDLSLRTYPGGEPIRDAAHARLLGRFRARLHPSLRISTEVPFPAPGDRRAWDLLVAGRGFRLGVEAESNPNDVQALSRRLMLKERDGRVDRLILLLPGTAGVGRFLEAAGTLLLAQFPLDGDRAMAFLEAGLEPPANAIVVLRRSRRFPDGRV